MRIFILTDASNGESANSLGIAVLLRIVLQFTGFAKVGAEIFSINTI